MTLFCPSDYRPYGAVLEIIGNRRFAYRKVLDQFYVTAQHKMVEIFKLARQTRPPGAAELKFGHRITKKPTIQKQANPAVARVYSVRP